MWISVFTVVFLLWYLSWALADLVGKISWVKTRYLGSKPARWVGRELNCHYNFKKRGKEEVILVTCICCSINTWSRCLQFLPGWHMLQWIWGSADTVQRNNSQSSTCRYLLLVFLWLVSFVWHAWSLIRWILCSDGRTNVFCTHHWNGHDDCWEKWRPIPCFAYNCWWPGD